MKNNDNEYEQIAIDFGDALCTTEHSMEYAESQEDKTSEKEIEVGAAIIVKPEIKRFCDGHGIPDCAREAYVKRLNLATKTVLIETEPNGKELGLLFMSDVMLA